MVPRPAAAFRPEERGGGAPGAESGTAAPARTPAPTAAPARTADQLLDLSDLDFDKGLRDLQVDVDIDPIDADVEQAAVLYADCHDEVARALLEDAVRVHRYGPGERLWMMLFDLYRLTGRRSSFEALASDYAQCFGQCSPGWPECSQQRDAPRAVGKLLFKGGLTADNDAAFKSLRQALEKSPDLHLDLAKVQESDVAGCGRLLGELHKARKARREIRLSGSEPLGEQLESRIRSGMAKDGDTWLMLLEIYQAQGRHERFDDLAIDYAVTFEISPPSWEEKRVTLPEPAPAEALAPHNDTLPETYVVSGDIKASRFAELATYIEVHNPVIIDCTHLSRIDFVSAGALLNVLSSAKRARKHIVFRHTNHLVAELFGVVGLKALADIVPAKL